MPVEVPHKVITGIPDVTWDWIDGHGNIKHVLDVDILRHDPHHLSKIRFPWIKVDRQSAEVTVLGSAKEWRCPWVFGSKVLSDRCQHRYEAVAPIRQRKDAEFVENVLSVGDGGKQPIEVVLIDALWKEGDNFEEFSGTGSGLGELRERSESAEYPRNGSFVVCSGREGRRGKLTECLGRERELNRYCQTLVVTRLKYLRSFGLPFLGQSIVIPHVVRSDGGKKCDGERVEVHSPDEFANDVRHSAVIVDPIKDVACRFH